MIKKWSIRYPAVGGEEERRAYVYLPTMYGLTLTGGIRCCIC